MISKLRRYVQRMMNATHPTSDVTNHNKLLKTYLIKRTEYVRLYFLLLKEVKIGSKNKSANIIDDNNEHMLNAHTGKGGKIQYCSK